MGIRLGSEYGFFFEVVEVLRVVSLGLEFVGIYVSRG